MYVEYIVHLASLDTLQNDGESGYERMQRHVRLSLSSNILIEYCPRTPPFDRRCETTPMPTVIADGIFGRTKYLLRKSSDVQANGPIDFL